MEQGTRGFDRQTMAALTLRAQLTPALGGAAPRGLYLEDDLRVQGSGLLLKPFGHRVKSSAKLPEFVGAGRRDACGQIAIRDRCSG